MKCPKCKVQMSKSEFQAGYCEVCGWERSRQERLQERKTQAQAKKVAAAKPQPKPETVKVTVTAQYEITIHSAGYIRNDGFSISDGDYQRSRFIANHVLVLSDGSVFAGQAILTAIAGDSHLMHTGKRLKVGRAKLYQVTADFINYLMDRNSYHRRSEREIQVQSRNDNLILWLVEIAGIA